MKLPFFLQNIQIKDDVPYIKKCVLNSHMVGDRIEDLLLSIIVCGGIILHSEEIAQRNFLFKSYFYFFG